MFCPKCGAENKKNARFCKNCGSALNQSLSNGDVESNNSIGSGSGKSIAIISITVIICVLIVVGTFVYLNSVHDDDFETVQVDASSSDDSVSNSDDDYSSSSSISTIESDAYSYDVQGVSFNLPTSGYMRTADAFRFTYEGNNCEIERVPQYETSSYNWKLDSISLSQDYQGGEPYHLTVNNHPWIGVKIQKGGNWYHISMNTDDVDEAEEMLSWMNEHNTWSAP